MTPFIITIGIIGTIGAYILGLWLYGKQVEQSVLEYLARKWRDDKQGFELWIYNLSIKVTKKEIAKSEQDV